MSDITHMKDTCPSAAQSALLANPHAAPASFQDVVCLVVDSMVYYRIWDDALCHAKYRTTRDNFILISTHVHTSQTSQCSSQCTLYRRFVAAQKQLCTSASVIYDWQPLLGGATGFTSAQEQALAVPAVCTSATHCITRAMRFRTAQADAGKPARDAGISATFSIQRDGILCEETWYGNIQNIVSLDLSHSTGSTIFFSVKWYNRNLVKKDPVSHGLRVIQCNGDASDFSAGDPLISVDKVNEQVLFGEIPFSMSKVRSPHLWVFSDVSSSQVTADHLMHDPQAELEIDIDL